MRVLVLSDIHSNYQALQAVVADARARGPVDAIWNLGDIVGYGPDPGRCIQLLRGEGAVTVPGNHDLAAIGRLSLRDFNYYAAEACRWTTTQISAGEAAYLESLPLREEQGPFTLVHGSPREPVWEYLASDELAVANLAHFATPCCLVGHTHVPLVFVLDGSDAGPVRSRAVRPTHGAAFTLRHAQDGALAGQRCIYNPGSVGQPRDRDPRASYAIYESDAQVLTHYRVPYDIEATQQRMAAAGLPDYLILRLAEGR